MQITAMRDDVQETRAKALWNRYMGSYDFLNKVDGYVENLNAIAEHIPAGANVLDAGSGTGNLSLILKERGVRVTALDFSESAIREHLTKDPAANVLKASLEDNLALESSRFDFVCCASVLFALSEAGRRRALREFARVLKPGGALLATAAAPRQRNGNLIGMHWRGNVKRSGYAVGAVRFLLDTPRLMRVWHYNNLLRKLPDNRGYHRMTPEEFLKLAEDSGLVPKALAPIYGSHFMLLHAVKTVEKADAHVCSMVALPVEA